MLTCRWSARLFRPSWRRRAARLSPPAKQSSLRRTPRWLGRKAAASRFGNPAECDLRDTGVPFVYVDETARNNLRYFYAVTAFDINSFQSGPSSLESPRTTKSTTPNATASNYQNTADVTVEHAGSWRSAGQHCPGTDARSCNRPVQWTDAAGERLRVRPCRVRADADLGAGIVLADAG